MGKVWIEFQGGRVVAQGLRVLAHLVVALALHGFVADRVDPPRLRGLDRPAGVPLEVFQGRTVVAVVEIDKGDVIGLGRHRAVGCHPARHVACRLAGGRAAVAKHGQDPAKTIENEP